jgi:hypothetical protein
MSKRQGKGVRQTMKGFPSGARKMARPHEDETFFARSSSSWKIESGVEPRQARGLKSAETTSVRGTS